MDIDKNDYLSQTAYVAKYGISRKTLFLQEGLEIEEIDGRKMIKDSMFNRLLFKKLRPPIIDLVITCSLDVGREPNVIAKKVGCPTFLIQAILSGHIK